MTDPKPAARSLRSLTSSATIVVAAIAIASATSLIVTTTILDRTTADVASSVESVRLVEEAEINLLLFARTTDAVVKRNIAGDLDAALVEMRQYVTSDEEARLLGHARESLDAYRRAAEDPANDVTQLEAGAFAALDDLVDLNVAQARAARAHSSSLARLANVIGIVLGAAIIAIATALLLWLRRRVLRPLYALADAVKRFGTGERTVRANEEGPREVQDMSRRFNEMADTLATQRESQIAFLGGVAHDVRTPLSALRVAVDMLGPDEPLPPEPQVRHLLGVISRQIDRLDRITGDFLDLSKIEAGKLELNLEDHDLRKLVRAVVEVFDIARDRIDVTLGPDAVLVRCDEVRITQAITNLVSNALKYSPSSERVQVVVATTGRDAVVEVVDHGAGIPREDHRRIFEPFRRGRTHDSIPGTGLGLFNVKQFVEAHGGRIEVESVPSRGSTFRIYLPLEAARPSRIPPAFDRRAPS